MERIKKELNDILVPEVRQLLIKRLSKLCTIERVEFKNLGIRSFDDYFL
ncbi:MAG: hypothetical protein NY202_02535 [Mollicutes bacterium UO1]